MIWMALVACTATSGEELYGWELTWSDEFDVDGAPDPTKWTHDVGGEGWGNEQLEYDTDRLDNAQVTDGWLVITAQREDYEDNAWTSARLKTQGLFAQQDGRFEARLQLPPGQGMWPAFWMLGEDIDEVGWPNCGEIDILEARGEDPHTTNAALHGPGYSGGDSLYGNLRVEEDLQDASHLYAVEWDGEHMAWFLDDQLVLTAHPGRVGGPWVYDHPFFLLLNLAVGGSYGLPPDESTPDRSQMFVDYVRVYERVR